MSTAEAREPSHHQPVALSDIGMLHDIIHKWSDAIEEATRRFERLPRSTRERIDQYFYPEEDVDSAIAALAYVSTRSRRQSAEETRRLDQLLDMVEQGLGSLLSTDDVELVHNVIRVLQKLPTRSLEQLRFFTSRSLTAGAGASYLVLQARWDPKRSQVTLEARHLYRLPEPLLHEINLEN